MKIIQTLLSIVLLVTAAAVVFGQNGDRILADGNPSLTTRMVSRYANLLEWSLGITFSPQDRAGVEEQLVQYWRTNDVKNVKGVLDTLAFEQNLSGVSETKKQELQPQIKQQVLATMERERADAMNALLLGIYHKNQNARSADAEPQDSLSDGGGGMSDLSTLVGKWQVLHGNSIVGVNINSGRIGDGNAMIAQYDIRPNGSVIFTFVLQQSNFGCTTRIKTSKTGRASIAGSRVTFAYDGGITVSEDGCNARYNYTKKLAPEREVFDFQIRTDASGKHAFCFNNDKLKDCAVKIN